MFIQGQHLLVIMFASICGIKSRAAFNWVDMILFNHCRPNRKKKRRCLGRCFPTLKQQGCEAMLRTIGSITVDSFSWKLKFDGFSLRSWSCFFFSPIPLKTACVQGVQIVECGGKSEPSHPIPPLAVFLTHLSLHPPYYVNALNRLDQRVLTVYAPAKTLKRPWKSKTDPKVWPALIWYSVGNLFS